MHGPPPPPAPSPYCPLPLRPPSRGEIKGGPTSRVAEQLSTVLRIRSELRAALTPFQSVTGPPAPTDPPTDRPGCRPAGWSAVRRDGGGSCLIWECCEESRRGCAPACRPLRKHKHFPPLRVYPAVYPAVGEPARINKSINE